MNQIRINSAISFTSKNHPIKPYTINTGKGQLYISEVNLDKDLTPSMLDKITRFYCRNFSDNTEDLEYKIYRIGSLEEKRVYEKNAKQYYQKIFKEKKIKDNVTMLIATDSCDRIQGACLSSPYFGVPGCLESTLWIDSLAVSPRYRHMNVAKELMNSSIKANEKTFTDVFLTGTIFAKKFYEKMGFRSLDKKNPEQKLVYEYLEQRRYDIPRYVIPFTKALQENRPRWYEKCIEFINDNNNLHIKKFYRKRKKI